MARPELNPINLGSVARGAAIELFEKAIAQVAANIADKSTDAKAARKITLTFSFKPDEDRRSAIVNTNSKVQLASVSDHTSKAYFGKDQEGHTYAFDQDPRQDVLFEKPAEEDNLLNFHAEAKN